MSETNFRGRSSFIFTTDDNDSANDDFLNWRTNATPTLPCVQQHRIDQYAYLGNSVDGFDVNDLLEFDFRNGDEMLGDSPGYAKSNDENNMLIANADRLDDTGARRLDVPDMNNSRAETSKKTMMFQSSFVSTILSDHDYLPTDQMIMLGTENDKRLVREKLEAECMSQRYISLSMSMVATQSKPSGSGGSQGVTSASSSALASILPSVTNVSKSNAETLTDPDGLQAILNNLPGAPLSILELNEFGDELKLFALKFVEKLRAKPAESESTGSVNDDPGRMDGSLCSKQSSGVANTSRSNIQDASTPSAGEGNKESEKCDQDGSSAMETEEPSYTFSRDHSEPLEYYGNTMESQSQDTEKVGDTNTEDTAELPLVRELKVFESFAKKMLINVQSWQRDAGKAANHADVTDKFRRELGRVADEFQALTKAFETKLGVSNQASDPNELGDQPSVSQPVDAVPENTTENAAIDKGSAQKSTASDDELLTVAGYDLKNRSSTSEQKTDKLSEMEDSDVKNSKAKQHWLASNSSDTLASASDSDSDYGVRRRKRKSKKIQRNYIRSDSSEDDDFPVRNVKIGDNDLGKIRGNIADIADTSIKQNESEFNLNDYLMPGSEEDEILIKNEPVMESPDKVAAKITQSENTGNASGGLTNGQNELVSDEPNLRPPESVEYEPEDNIEPLDIGGDFEGDFYGFNASDTDEMPASSIFEIGVKLELSQTNPVINTPEAMAEAETQATTEIDRNAVAEALTLKQPTLNGLDSMAFDGKSLASIANIEDISELGDKLLADEHTVPAEQKSQLDQTAQQNGVVEADASKDDDVNGDEEEQDKSSKQNSVSNSISSSLENLFDGDASPFDTTGLGIQVSSSDDSNLSELSKSFGNDDNHSEPTNKSLVNGGPDEPHESKDKANDDDTDDQNDKEIEKLLDFSPLLAKRKSVDAHQVFKAGANASTTKPNKRQKKDDLLDILEQSNKTVDSDSGSESDDEKITEEQFLKERNLNMKNSLLRDTSSESEAEATDGDEPSEKKVNGVHGSDNDDSDQSMSNIHSDSDESVMGKFLNKKVIESIHSARSSQGHVDRDASDEKSPSTSINRKHDLLGPNLDKLIDDLPVDDGLHVVDELVADLDHNFEEIGDAELEEAEKDDALHMETEISGSQKSSGSDGGGTSARKSKAQIGKKVFGNLDKSMEIISPSDKTDDDKSETSKTHSRKSSANNSDCEILDTSMFKGTKTKAMDGAQLSKILSNTNRHKPTATRAIPDDCISLSSDSDLEMEPPVPKSTVDDEAGEEVEEEKSKRSSRPMLRTDQLAGETKRAQREETERVKRLEKKQERLSQIIASQQIEPHGDGTVSDVSEVILDYDSKQKKSIFVHKEIVKFLKPHQIDGIKFMYDCCYGGVDSIEKYTGSGCILAHCMGLGKTLQLIALLHTVISYPQLKTNKVLVICPKSTVMNWKDEIERWLSPVKAGRKLKLFHFADYSDIKEKIKILSQWHQSGRKANHAGCLLIGYEAYRTLVGYHNSKKSINTFPAEQLDQVKANVKEYLLNPGSDLVICDEGHMIKNRKSATSLAVNQIKTKRRIILTGTPIQNNLKEYYSMVDFIKPSFLGTEKEFGNLYANPIKNGQHKDSSNSEIKFMKERSYVLHKKLSKFVQRREAALLKTFLPEKYEYVLFIPMTDVQNKLYEYFLENNPLRAELGGKSLIPDYTILRKIWTHPKVLENAYLNAIEKRRKEQAAAAQQRSRRQQNAESEEDQPDDVLDSQTGKMAVTNNWWRDFVSSEDMETILPSNKLKILFEILNMCKQKREKCLIFSAFVAVLDVVEFFMKLITEQEESMGAKKYPGMEHFRGPWKIGKDYYRLDGKTPKSIRHEMITHFNDPTKEQTRVFLISAKAGGQGINLTGANRVVLLDTSWNPSNDQQNIFRVFRLGQKKVCYIYRLLAMGTMEEKVYSRSVTKQAMSFRVVDEQQIDRHYNMAELTELYTLTKPDLVDRPTPKLPNDEVLAYLLHTYPSMAYKYHEHDSLLEKNTDEDLSEEEKAQAWAAYESDVTMRTFNMGAYGDNFGMSNPYGLGFSSFSSMMNSYSAYNSSMSYLNQMGYQPTNMEGDMDILRSLYANPYSGYNPLYSGLGTGSATTNSLFNAVTPGVLSSPPPSVSSPSSLIGYNPLNFGSRSGLLGNPAASSSLYNSRDFLSAAAQPSVLSGSKSGFNSLMSNAALSMYGNGMGYNPFASVTSTSTMPSSTTTTSASKPGTSLFDPNMYYLQHGNGFYGPTNTSRPTNTPSPLGQQAGVGPNAKRNPMLSKELSIPSLMPRSSHLDGIHIPSIPTSVIKSPSASTSAPALPSPSSSSVVARASPVAVASPASTVTTPPVDLRRPPSRSSSTATNKNDKATLPEPHIIIKNVSSINKSVQPVQPLTPEIVSSKPPTELIQTKSHPNTISNTSPNPSNAARSITNMGIVYPDKANDDARNTPPGSIPKTNMGIVYPSTRKDAQSANPSGMKLVPNSSLLKTAQTQLQSLNNNNKNMVPVTAIASNVAAPTTALAQVNKIIQQQQQKAASPTNSPIRRAVTVSSPTTVSKPGISAALANNKSLTITPTSKRNQLNNGGKLPMVNNNVTISPIGNIPASVSSLSGVQITKNVNRAPSNSQLNSGATTIIKTIPKNNNQIVGIGGKIDNMTAMKSTALNPNQGGITKNSVVMPRIVASSSISPRTRAQQPMKMAQPPFKPGAGPIGSPITIKPTPSRAPRTTSQRNVIVHPNQNMLVNKINNPPGRTMMTRPKAQSVQPPALTRLSSPAQAHSPAAANKMLLSSMGKAKTQPVINRPEIAISNRPPIRAPPMTGARKRTAPPVAVAANSRAVPTSISNLIGSNAVSITHVKRQRTADKPGANTLPGIPPKASSVTLRKENPFQGVQLTSQRGVPQIPLQLQKQRRKSQMNTQPIEIVDLD